MHWLFELNNAFVWLIWGYINNYRTYISVIKLNVGWCQLQANHTEYQAKKTIQSAILLYFEIIVQNPSAMTQISFAFQYNSSCKELGTNLCS